MPQPMRAFRPRSRIIMIIMITIMIMIILRLLLIITIITTIIATLIKHTIMSYNIMIVGAGRGEGGMGVKGGRGAGVRRGHTRE